MKTFDVLPSEPEPLSRRFKFIHTEKENRQSFIIVCIFLWSILTYLFITHFVMMAVEIKGASMWPTLLDGQRYMLYRAPYHWRAPHRGEIVVIRDPEDHQLSIKRIVGLPNDLIEIRHTGVYINNIKFSEPYLTSFSTWASGNRLVKPTRLGPSDYFVMGDNRDRSADSRIYGAVPRNFILGVISKTN
ncbi:MAG TPA: signal peptidase I [Verrucomicrobiae bacterium]|jgi:signal peptidase I|nr:signal peptidase I [Verrucomicrobiae bacterium]